MIFFGTVTFFLQRWDQHSPLKKKKKNADDDIFEWFSKMTSGTVFYNHNDDCSQAAQHIIMNAVIPGTCWCFGAPSMDRAYNHRPLNFLLTILWLIFDVHYTRLRKYTRVSPILCVSSEARKNRLPKWKNVKKFSGYLFDVLFCIVDAPARERQSRNFCRSDPVPGPIPVLPKAFL